jgi:hypothetical protein
MPKRICPPDKIITDLYDSGMTPAQIGKHLGIKKNTICGRLRLSGHKLRTISEAIKINYKNGQKPVKYWEGKKQPLDMVENRINKIRGEKHYLWKGGKHRRGYRGNIEKKICADCGGKLNLGIHHKDLDHYNNAPENLQVLCVSCHMSLHKQMYWDAIKAGETPPKSNGIVGWSKDD